MKLSGREMMLGWGTAVVVILGATYWFGESKVKQWNEVSGLASALNGRIEIAQRMLEQKDEWNQKLNTRQAELPQHPMDKDVKAELLRTIEQTAQENGLVLLRREPEAERNLGNLYEVSINCTWEGGLEQLVGFLYAVQSKGAILDVQQLTVAPAPGSSGGLKGSFTVDCAYTRQPAGS